jgi:hypothetical protein
MVQSVQVITTESNDRSRAGIALCGGTKEFDRKARRADPRAAKALLRRLERDKAPDRRSVKGQVQLRSGANLEDVADGERHVARSLKRRRLVPHGEVGDARKDVSAVDAHRTLLGSASALMAHSAGGCAGQHAPKARQDLLADRSAAN